MAQQMLQDNLRSMSGEQLFLLSVTGNAATKALIENELGRRTRQRLGGERALRIADVIGVATERRATA